jgi:hypothetical protein
MMERGEKALSRDVDIDLTMGTDNISSLQNNYILLYSTIFEFMD